MSALAVDATAERRLRRLSPSALDEARALIAVEDATAPEESLREAVTRIDGEREARNAELRETVPAELARARKAYVSKRTEAEQHLNALLAILPDCAAARAAYTALHSQAITLDCADHVREYALAPDVHSLLLHIGNA